MPRLPRKATRSLTYLQSILLGAAFVTDAIDLGESTAVHFTISPTTNQTPAGVFTLQASVDGTTWAPSRNPDTTLRTLTIGSNAQPYSFNNRGLGARFVRLSWVPQTPGYTDTCSIQYSTKP